LDHNFEDYSPLLTGAISFGFVARKPIKTIGHGSVKPLTNDNPEIRRKDQVPTIIFKGIPTPFY
jgi:hypothetical protein